MAGGPGKLRPLQKYIDDEYDVSEITKEEEAELQMVGAVPAGQTARSNGSAHPPHPAIPRSHSLLLGRLPLRHPAPFSSPSSPLTAPYPTSPGGYQLQLSVGEVGAGRRLPSLPPAAPIYSRPASRPHPYTRPTPAPTLLKPDSNGVGGAGHQPALALQQPRVAAEIDEDYDC